MKILKWTILWLVTWGISQWLWGGDPLEATPVPGTILSIFLASLVLAFVLFPSERKIWLSRMSPLGIPIILFSIIIFSILDERLLLSNMLTSTHVLFQQFMIAVLAFMVPSEKFSRTATRVLVLFGASHLLLIIFMSWPWTVFFTLIVSAVAVFWTYLIQRVKHGITISYLIHLGFYLVFFSIL